MTPDETLDETTNAAPAADASKSDPSAAAAAPAEIVARAGRWYRTARYVMVLGCFAMAAWFARDGWVTYPNANAAYDQAIARKEKPAAPKHSDLDIFWQRALAVALPFAGLGILAWLLYRSRGCYRLADDVLYVPGHPPIPLDAITEIDKTKWKKKGIAYLDYEVVDPATNAAVKSTVKLDDFVYEQEATDDIFKAIEKRLVPEAEAVVGGDGEADPREKSEA